MLSVRRRKDRSVQVTLPVPEAILLQSVPSRLRALLEDPDATNRAVQRLFPRAYEDPEKDAEYKRLLGDEMRVRKLQSVEVFEKTVLAASLARGKVTILISPEQFEQWLGCINDLRLVLGTELEIEDDDWSSSFDPDHPRADDLALLHYLSWLEEGLLAAG